MVNITTPVSAIKVIQYKLDDCKDGKPKSMDEVGCGRLTQNPQMIGFSQIVLLDDDHFGVLHPVCPECGSRKYVKNGFRERHPILGDFGKITVYVQRYICRKCGKGFSANIDGIIEKGRWFARRFKEMANSLAAIMKYSSRTIRQVLLAVFGVSPSHQTIENWFLCKIPELPASGHYSYDEQCIKLKGERSVQIDSFRCCGKCSFSR